MSNYAPGWYPDGSGRYAQRYYDGTNWTEHVVDAAGQSTLDPVPGVTVPPQDAPVHASAPAPTTSPLASQRAWGQPAGSSGHRPSGTSSSSFQFGAAPSHDRAYAPTEAGVTDPAPGSTAPAFRRTVGTIAAGVGLALVVLAVLVLDYWSGGGESVSLGVISDASASVNGVVGAYASVGRWIGLLVAAAIALLAALDAMGGHPLIVSHRRTLTIVAGVAGAAFALWHLIGLFLTPDVGPGVDVGPALTGFVGMIGYALVAAWGVLRHPLTTPSR